MVLDLSKRYKKWQDYDYCLKAVKEDGYALKYIKEQTPEICLEAVKQNGYALIYVNQQTPEICLEAVKQKGDALQYVKEQTPELILNMFYYNRDLDINLVKITEAELDSFYETHPEWKLF